MISRSSRNSLWILIVCLCSLTVIQPYFKVGITTLVMKWITIMYHDRLAMKCNQLNNHHMYHHNLTTLPYHHNLTMLPVRIDMNEDFRLGPPWNSLAPLGWTLQAPDMESRWTTMSHIPLPCMIWHQWTQRWMALHSLSGCPGLDW